MAGKNVVELTDANWEQEVLKSDVPVMVDFWAEWCGPCKMIAPTVDALATDYAGKLKVGKLNVDDNTTATRYNIRGIPTLLIFQGGQVRDQLVGAQPKAAIEKVLSKYVNS
jgi:thioredoxin 1